MKKIFLLLVACAIISCNERTALSKIRNYSTELDEMAGSHENLDTAAANSKFDEFGIASISADTLGGISREHEFMELLRTEKELLEKWERIPDFRQYNLSEIDTLTKLVGRCGTFDTGAPDLPRRAAYRGLRTLSAEYYIVRIPIAFHVITNRAGKGQLPGMNAKIKKQVQILNEIYSRFNISFKIISVDYTINDSWFNNASTIGNVAALEQMTAALAKDPDRTLNVYSLDLRLLGEATFPWYPTNGTPGDFVLMNFNTLPGGPATFSEGLYTEGKTLVHEIGHYLGLLHTFEGGEFRCDVSPPHEGCSIGDQVEDTPGQRICYFKSCDENLDTCPDPGKDPVRNYMGYNPDACMSEFTNGQGDRLIQTILKYRGQFIENPVP